MFGMISLKMSLNSLNYSVYLYCVLEDTKRYCL